jgi:hypothetical protein
MSKTKKDVPVTVEEAAAILQSAVSYCQEAGLRIQYAVTEDQDGNTAFVLAVVGLTAQSNDDGSFEIQCAANGTKENADSTANGTLESTANGTPEKAAEVE